MKAANGRGALLAERLGIQSIGRDGHNIKAACIGCDSSDAFRVHQDTGVAYCHSCNGRWSRLKLATARLGDQKAAWALLEEIGLEQPQHRANGHHASCKGKPFDAIEAVAKAKGVSAESLKAYGAKAIFKKVRLPTYGPDGKQCSTFTMSVAGKGLFEKGKKAGLFFPHESGAVRLPAAGETWHLVEGPKDAAALHGLGLLACGMNTCRLAPKFARLFASVNVILVPDRDTAGVEGANKSARALAGVAATIRVAHLPAEVKDKSGEDVRDILKRDGGPELVLQAIADAATCEPPSDKSLPEIVVDVNEKRVNDEAIASLANHPDIYQRGNSLVHVTSEAKLPKNVQRPLGLPRIAEIPTPSLREMMAERASFVVVTEGEEGEQRKPVHPPAWCVAGVAARGAWSGIRCLEFVTETPVLRPDGTVLQTAGYDADLAAIYLPNAPFPPIDNEPSQQDACFAKDELLEVVEDFPFESEPHRSAWLAAVLTPLARAAFFGPAPLIFADANVRGAGKGLMLDCAGHIVSGRDFARMSACENDAEWRKTILSIAVAGDPLVLIDNITGAFGSPALDAALTATSWSGRLLGETKSVTCPLSVTWFATGNNVILKGDMPRRILQIRLLSQLEKPEERTGFKRPDLLAWVREERPRLVAAALTILRAYCRAGRPKQNIKPWGSFGGWSDLIRGAIVWLGSPDPGLTRANISDSADSEAAALRALIAGWQEADADDNGRRVADVLDEMKANERRFSTLRAALADVFGSKPGELPSSRSVGMKFHHWKHRIIDGRYLDKHDGKSGAVWFVRAADASGD